MLAEEEVSGTAKRSRRESEKGTQSRDIVSRYSRLVGIISQQASAMGLHCGMDT